MLTKFQQETHIRFQAKMFQHAWWRQAPGLGVTQPGLSHSPGPSPANGWHLLLSNAMSFCPTEAVSLHHHFFVVCFDCTMRTAREIVRRLQLRMHFNGQQSCRNPLMLTPVWANCSCPLTEPGLLWLFFFPKVSRISSLYWNKNPELD